MKTIGIIGGMSFESTITYYKTINQAINDKLKSLNSAKILLYSVNFEEIENLQSQDKWQEAAQILTQCAKKLELAGANFIIIATNTMHKVFDEIQQNINIPILHIAKSSAKALKQENIQGMKKIIITVGRQFGSGGHVVATSLSKKLGIPMYDSELITKAAEMSGFSTDFF